MPVYNLGAFGPKAKKAGGAETYGLLVDQIAQIENGLSGDNSGGTLAPGDYDYLIQETQKAANYPGLTTAQRSNFTVKISQYQKNKSVADLKKTTDISRMNGDVKDDLRKLTMMAANDPQKYLSLKSRALNAKAQQLVESINQRRDSGEDVNEYNAEYYDTLNELQDTEGALNDVMNSAEGGKSQNYAAYITTNTDGEIVDMQIGKHVQKSGYQDTNAVFGGLQVVGKSTKDPYGKNIFRLGGTNYSSASSVMPDPNNEGAFMPSVLLSDDVKQEKGSFSIGESEFRPVDLQTIRPQSTVRVGGWAQGEKGVLYNRKEDGSYSKYSNVDKKLIQEKYGLNDSSFLPIDRDIESNLNSQSTTSFDGSGGIALPETMQTYPQQFPTPNSKQMSGAPGEAGSFSGAKTTVPGRSLTPSPVERAPTGASGIAGQAIQKAKSFVGSLFA